MVRRTKEERKAAVIQASVDHILRAQLEWSDSLTYLTLATETGIDQAQIARDFGSKESLASEIVAVLMGPEVFDRFLESNRFWIDTLAVGREPIPVLCGAIGQYFEDLIVQDRELIQGHLALWATSEPGSIEWLALGKIFDQLLTGTGDVIRAATDQAAERGAVITNHMTPQEFITVVDATVEGLLVRKTLTPHLVPEGLIARTIGSLLAGFLTADGVTPYDRLAQVPAGS